MALPDFFQTRTGVRLIEKTLPELVNSINQLADKLDKVSKLFAFDEVGALKTNIMPPVLWVLTFAHKNGNTVWVRSSEAKMMATIKAVIEHWVDKEITDPKPKAHIRRLLARGDVAEAAVEYASHTGERFMWNSFVLDSTAEEETKG